MLLRYAAMRLSHLVPMVLVVTMVVFFVMMVIPGDPVMVMLGAVDGAPISKEVYDAMRLRLGLDQPLIVQYVHWLWGILHGDLGTVVETVFSYPGIGYLLLNSIHSRDFVVVQGVVLFMVFLVIVVNLTVDILYAVLDPRIRYR